MRVFHLIKGLGRGGAETLLAESYACRGTGFEYAYAYFLPWKDHLHETLESQGARVLQLTARSSLGVLMRLPSVVSAVKTWAADLIHCHLPLSGVVGRLAGKLAGLPVVYTEHNLQERYHPATRWLNLATWRMQSHAIAVSAEVAESMARHGARHVPVSVVLNGVSLERFRPDPQAGIRARERLGIPLESPVVGSVAVFRTQKRFDLWLEAAAQLREERPDTRFVLVGHGPLQARLEQQARELGLNEALVFAGIQEDVRPFLNAFDVFLMTSEFEGLPVALLEALASERAVVATAVGGIPEVLRDGKNGLLLPPGDVDVVSASLRRVVSDPDLRRRLGAEGRRTVEHRFSLPAYMANLEAIYGGLV